MVRSLDSADERLQRILDTLVEVGRALTSCGDLAEAISRVAGSFVQEIGDYCSIEVLDNDLARGLCIRAGSLPDSQLESGGLIVEPLSDGRTTLGTIACLPRAGEPHDTFVRQVVQVLATQLGVVLAARLMSNRERDIADRLQRALLPERLPLVPGAVFTAAYRPAGDEASVGGDWFDVFPLPGDRIGVCVGDVAGHGLDAAIVMGEVRQAMRSAAVAADSPAGVLDHVNRILMMRDSVGIVTAIFGMYDPAAGTLSYAIAGHPPPLLALANGLVRRLPSGNLPLGCTDALDCKEWTFTVPAGGHAIFYTDGLIENDRDLVAGERRLADTVRSVIAEQCAGDPNADPALAIQERILSGTPNRDDAAVLVLARTAPSPYYCFTAVPVTAAISRAIIADELERRGIANERRFGVTVALGEAVANAIEHAYREGAPGLVRFEIQQESGLLTVVVEDFGHWRPFVAREERGRGIDLMHKFMDGVQIRSASGSTRILLSANLET